MLTAIVGVNWGDEGKGRMVDLLSERYDVVVRYQGGNNAGHTVVNDKGKFVLNLMPSGILRDGTVNVLGPGMVIDLEHLCGEVERLRSRHAGESEDQRQGHDLYAVSQADGLSGGGPSGGKEVWFYPAGNRSRLCG